VGCKEENSNQDDQFSLINNNIEGTIKDWDLGTGKTLRFMAHGNSGDFIIIGTGEIQSDGSFDILLDPLPSSENYLHFIGNSFVNNEEGCEDNVTLTEANARWNLNEITNAVLSGENGIGSIYRSNNPNPDLYWLEPLNEGDIWIELMYVDKAVQIAGKVHCTDGVNTSDTEINLNYKEGYNEYVIYCTEQSSNIGKGKYLSEEPSGENIKWYFDYQPKK
jgi:hypothetical protein